MTDLDALLADLTAHPDDRERTLVYADALIEAGDDFGELIALQTSPTSPTAITEERELELRRRFEKEILGEAGAEEVLVDLDIEWRWGFIRVLCADEHTQFSHRALRLIERLNLWPPTTSLGEHISVALPCLSTLEISLDAQNPEIKDLAALESRLPALRRFSISNSDGVLDFFEPILDGRILRRATEFGFFGDDVVEDVLRAVAESKISNRIQALGLDYFVAMLGEEEIEAVITPHRELFRKLRYFREDDEVEDTRDYAMFLHSVGQSEFAERVLAKARRQDPNDVELVIAEANLLADTDRPSEARAAIRQAILLDPEGEWAHEIDEVEDRLPGIVDAIRRFFRKRR